MIHLAVNVIETVRGAEALAEDVTRTAAVQAAQLLDEAQNEAIRLQHKAEDDARALAAGKLAAAHEESRKELEAAMGELDSEMQALCERARQNQGQAVRMILEMLV